MEVLLDDKRERITRFQSQCHEPGCAIDVCELKDGTPRFVIVEFYATPARLRHRIRWCWRMLTKGVGFEHEFVVRPEDAEALGRTIAGVEEKKGDEDYDQRPV